MPQGAAAAGTYFTVSRLMERIFTTLSGLKVLHMAIRAHYENTGSSDAIHFDTALQHLIRQMEQHYSAIDALAVSWPWEKVLETVYATDAFTRRM